MAKTAEYTLGHVYYELLTPSGLQRGNTSKTMDQYSTGHTKQARVGRVPEL